MFFFSITTSEIKFFFKSEVSDNFKPQYEQAVTLLHIENSPRKDYIRLTEFNYHGILTQSKSECTVEAMIVIHNCHNMDRRTKLIIIDIHSLRFKDDIHFCTQTFHRTFRMSFHHSTKQNKKKELQLSQKKQHDTRNGLLSHLYVAVNKPEPVDRRKPRSNLLDDGRIELEINGLAAPVTFCDVRGEGARANLHLHEQAKDPRRQGHVSQRRLG